MKILQGATLALIAWLVPGPMKFSTIQLYKPSSDCEKLFTVRDGVLIVDPPYLDVFVVSLTSLYTLFLSVNAHFTPLTSTIESNEQSRLRLAPDCVVTYVIDVFTIGMVGTKQ